MKRISARKTAKDCDCGGYTTVVDSRVDKFGRIRRRRLCMICGKRFSTLEVRILQRN